MLVKIGSGFGIGNAQGVCRLEQPRAVDHPVLRIVETVGKPEHGLDRARQLIARLAGEAGRH